MRKKTGGIAVLLASTIWLAGCMEIRSGGPCYGFGCGATSTAPSGQNAQQANPKTSQSSVSAKNGSAEKPHTAEGQ
jgi:hypothetical protein